jgi:hypothetical protein
MAAMMPSWRGLPLAAHQADARAVRAGLETARAGPKCGWPGGIRRLARINDTENRP